MKNESGGCFGATIKIIILLALFLLCLKLFVSSLSEFDVSLDSIFSFSDSDDDTNSSPYFSSSKKIFNIGDTITTDKFEITITEVEERTEVGTSASASDGNIFVCVRAKIKNITGAKIGTASQPYFCLVDGKNVDYFSETLASLQYAVEKGTGNQPEFNSGVTIYDDMVFEIDKNYYTQNTFNLEIWASGTILVKIK